MTGERVSVVIPTYNYGMFIEGCIESVLSQTHPVHEILVVDDGSTDNTAEIVTRIQDSRIRYIRQDNQGNYFARNKALAEVTGEFVAFLDADDTWLPHKTKVQLDVFRNNPDIALCCTDYDDIFLDHLKPIRPAIRKRPFRTHCAVQFPIRQMLVSGWCFNMSTVLVRKSCLDEIGPFDTAFQTGMDNDMWLRIAFNHKVYYLHEKQALRVIHEDQTNVKHIPVRIPVFHYVLRKITENRAGYRFMSDEHLEAFIQFGEKLKTAGQKTTAS